MKRNLLIFGSLALGLTSMAADFFSTERCETLFDLGVRVGLNTSNRTVGKNAMAGYERQTWGTGFDAGVVANINIRDYIAIQPGVYFESRSGDYTFIEPFSSDFDSYYYITQVGHRRSYNIKVPILASLRFNISDDLKWLVEAGPYVSFMLGKNMDNKVLVSTAPVSTTDAAPFRQDPTAVDFGFRLGTGLKIWNHYTVGVHYDAGAVKAYKDLSLGNYKQVFGGRTKAWVFTIGYDF